MNCWMPFVGFSYLLLTPCLVNGFSASTRSLSLFRRNNAPSNADAPPNELDFLQKYPSRRAPRPVC
jgi:hypothetical protein